MAEMTIQLRTDPETGKKDIIVELHSDDDALPHEHEQQHRALVQKLIEGGVVDAEEVGKIVVDRGQSTAQPDPQSGQSTQDQPQAQAQAQAEGH